MFTQMAEHVLSDVGVVLIHISRPRGRVCVCGERGVSGVQAGLH